MMEELERFFRSVWDARVSMDHEPDRVLATVPFTDIVGSSERAAVLGDRRWREVLEQHHEHVRRQLLRFRGAEVDTAGDGFLVSFDEPARAIRCACAILDSVRELGLDLRAGLHTGVRACPRQGERNRGPYGRTRGVASRRRRSSRISAVNQDRRRPRL
jgi:class 3 adenylate cyclase